MALKLVVVTPEKKVVDSEADEVQMPGVLGYLGILPGHAPLITELATGILTYKKGSKEARLALSAGFAEVAEDTVTVLAELAEEPGEIDSAAAARERERAEGELGAATPETLDAIRTRIALADARLEVARKG